MPFRLWDQIRDWALLLILLFSSVVLMLSQNEQLLSGLRGLALTATSWGEAQFAWVGRFFRALEENELLRQENIDLSSQLARAREARLENERFRSMLAFRDSSAYPLLAAQIISKDIFRQDNYFILDVGREEGVEVDMAVVDERGILGKIVFVSAHYSRVMPYLNTDFRVPAKIHPTQVTGIVSWAGTRRDELRLDFIVKTEPVEKNQLVVTSGFSNIFPPGYPIGLIDSVAVQPGRNEYVIYLSPVSPLDKAEYAFVILQKTDPELVDLIARPTR